MWLVIILKQIIINLLKYFFNIGRLKELELKTDAQLHRVLRNFEELEQLRIAVLNDINKYNTIRYINDKDIIKSVKSYLENEKKMNEEFAKERY